MTHATMSSYAQQSAPHAVPARSTPFSALQMHAGKLQQKAGIEGFGVVAQVGEMACRECWKAGVQRCRQAE